MSVPAQGHHDDDSYGAPEGGHGAGDSAPQGTHEHSVTAFRRPDMQGSTAHEHRIKPRNSAGRDLKSAIGVGVGLGAVVLLAIFVIPGGWYPLVALAAAAATWEVHSRLKEHGYVVSLPTVLVGGQCAGAHVWPLVLPWQTFCAAELSPGCGHRCFCIDVDSPVRELRCHVVADQRRGGIRPLLHCDVYALRHRVGHRRLHYWRAVR